MNLRNHHHEIKQLRDQGYTLKDIAVRFCGSKQGVSLVLMKHYHTTDMATLVTRHKLAHQLGCDQTTLKRLETLGIINSMHRGSSYYYNKQDIDRIQEILDNRKPQPDVELVCEECGCIFTRKHYQINKNSPGRFCGRKCLGVSIGRTYGFKKGHGGFGGSKKKNRKWDYALIYDLYDKTRWNARIIGEELGIPGNTVRGILTRRGGYNPIRDPIWSGGRTRTLDWEAVYRLRDETGWGACRISARLGMSKASVSRIMANRLESKEVG